MTTPAVAAPAAPCHEFLRSERDLGVARVAIDAAIKQAKADGRESITGEEVRAALGDFLRPHSFTADCWCGEARP